MRYRVVKIVSRAERETLCSVPDFLEAVKACRTNKNSYVIDSNSEIMFSNVDVPFSSEWERRCDREKTVAVLVAVFEKFLADRGIAVPHDDDEDGEGVIFGYNYAELSGNLEDKLVDLGLLTNHDGCST